MLGGAEGGERERRAGQRMPGAHDADIAAFAEAAVAQRRDLALGRQCRQHFREMAQGHVDVGMGQQLARVAVEQRPHLDLAARAERREARHQRRQQEGGHRVGHGQAEYPGVERRVEVGSSAARSWPSAERTCGHSASPKAAGATPLAALVSKSSPTESRRRFRHC